MEALFSELKNIEEFLEQISTITANQTTVLLQVNRMQEEELLMIEEMVGYKEQLIDQLQIVEHRFSTRYAVEKGKLREKNDILIFKACVARILDKKKKIQELERNNVLILQSKAIKNKKKEIVSIHKPAKDVMAAYKQQLKS